MMNPPLTHRQQLERCLAGEKTSRVPVALWRHFPVDDQTPDALAAAISHFQRLYDFDLIKVTPASSFCIKDWGVEDQWNGNFEGTRDYNKFAIQKADDWTRLKILDPRKGHLGEQLTCLQLLIREFAPHTPILQTIFSPLAQAKNLIGKDKLHLHLRQYPDALHAGLKRIAESTLRFIEEAKRLQITGIFFATQHATYNLLSEDEFLTFGKAYDLQVLQAAQDLWLNMAHIHGEDIMFDLVADYPVQILNWHDRHTPPSLAEAQKRFPGVVCGGLQRWETLTIGNPTTVTTEARQAIRQTGGRRFILGTGCVLPIIAPHANIQAARQSME